MYIERGYICIIEGQLLNSPSLDIPFHEGDSKRSIIMPPVCATQFDKIVFPEQSRAKPEDRYGFPTAVVTRPHISRHFSNRYKHFICPHCRTSQFASN